MDGRLMRERLEDDVKLEHRSLLDTHIQKKKKGHSSVACLDRALTGQSRFHRENLGAILNEY